MPETSLLGVPQGSDWSPVRISLTYALFGAAWIAVTDSAASVAVSGASQVLIQLVKGLLYVGVTAVFVYWLVRRAQTRILGERGWYQGLFELSPDAVFVISPEGRYVEANTVAVERYGYSREELLQLGPEALADPSCTAQVSSRLRTSQYGPVRFSWVHRTRGGERLDVEVIARPLIQNGERYVLSCARDMSASVRARHLLRRSVGRYRTIARNLPNGAVQVLDREFRYLYSEGEVLARLGLTRAELRGKTIQEVLPAAGAGVVAQHLLRVLDGETVRFEVELRGAWLLAHAAPLRNTAGDIDRILVLSVDISERHRAHRELQRSERRFHRALASIPDVIAIYGPDRRVRYVNDAIAGILGLPAEECLGKRDEEVLPPEICKHYLPALRRATRTAAVQDVELTVELPQTGSRRLSITCVPLLGRSGEVEEVLRVTRDLTEQTKAIRERELLIAAVEQAPVAILITDSDGTIRYANPRFEKASGYAAQEVVGKNPRILKSGSQDKAFYREMWETLKEPSTWTGRFVNRRKDGTVFTEDATIAPVLDADGLVVAYVAAKRDITDELALQAQYEHAQKMESVGRLAGGVAHDFNNMLSVILGQADLGRMCIGDEAAVIRALGEIRNAASRSADLTRQLLAFARKQTVLPRVLDLNQTVSSMLGMLCRLIGEEIDLAWLPGEDVPPILMDPAQLDQILANLCVNARDAIVGAGKITISTQRAVLDEARCVDTVSAKPGVFAQLRVTDDGEGMTREVLQSVFEPYFTTKEPGTGTGLGLATVYGIVCQNRGALDVESKVGVGTVFSLCLPMASGEPECFPESTPNDLPRGEGEVVLLVEDERGILEVAARILRWLGYVVVEARTPTEAHRWMASGEGEPDLLLTDVILPEMDGKELAMSLCGLCPRLKVLYMSGYSERVIACRGVLEEGVHFLPKPFTAAGMAYAVRRALAAETDAR